MTVRLVRGILILPGECNANYVCGCSKTLTAYTGLHVCERGVYLGVQRPVRQGGMGLADAARCSVRPGRSTR